MEKYIVFDLGGVLMQHNREACQRRLTELFGADNMADILGHLPNGAGRIGSLMHRYELGDCTTDEFMDTLCAIAVPGTSRQEIIEAWNLIHAGIPDRYTHTLYDLRARGYRLLLLSNNSSLRWQHVLDTADMSMFEQFFLSFQMHILKPDIRIYRAVNEYIGSIDSPIMFVDDLEPNRLVAESLGWQTFDSVETLLQHLPDC